MLPADQTKLERVVSEKSSDSSPSRLLHHRPTAAATLSSERPIECWSSADDLVTPQKMISSGKFEESSCDSSMKRKQRIGGGCESANDENEIEGCSSGSSSRFRIRLFSPASTPSASGILKRGRVQDSPDDRTDSPANRHVHFAPDLVCTNDEDGLEQAEPSPPVKRLRLVDSFNGTPDAKQSSESKRKSSFADKFSPRTHALITSILKHNKLDDLGFTAIKSACPPNRCNGTEANSNGGESTVARSQLVWPSLVNDKSDVTALFSALANPSSSNLALSDYLASKNVSTVGQLAQMTELQAHFLPIKPPKMSVLRSVLESYEKQRKMANCCRIESDGPSDSCLNTILLSPQRLESVENENVENEEINKAHSINEGDEHVENSRADHEEISIVNLLTYESGANILNENWRDDDLGASNDDEWAKMLPLIDSADIGTQTESTDDFKVCVENLCKLIKRKPTAESLSLKMLFDLFENLQSAVSYVVSLVKFKLTKESSQV